MNELTVPDNTLFFTCISPEIEALIDQQLEKQDILTDIFDLLKTLTGASMARSVKLLTTRPIDITYCIMITWDSATGLSQTLLEYHLDPVDRCIIDKVYAYDE